VWTGSIPHLFHHAQSEVAVLEPNRQVCHRKQLDRRRFSVRVWRNVIKYVTSYMKFCMFRKS